ncbi:MogA/MoaB family molybdenum cofactor biosynthesis protein [Salarchaeum japonicum]|uniref:Molybdenum cofactor biosynthesis protein MoaB n=1 Tax=Salarchaeum japonicum TaxID=555573 RepID=A0AAV3SXL4_9EURY|nr:MogA/MoaB family molybdenum cofactor biosynthesis protein [Salarchaeum japonicum]
MVDFQSRDTRRDTDDDADPADAADDDGEQADHGHTPDDHHTHENEHDDHDDHSHHDADVASLGVGVVTVSSSRSLDDDPSGDAIAAAFEREGHAVATRELVRDDYDRVQAVVNRLVGRDDVNTVVTTGGTGVTPDDQTVEAVRPLLEKRLPGFGELFRRLSYDDIGTRVVGTRALAGIADGVPVFCLPGSENAATLGAEDIIVPEAPHLAGLSQYAEDEA